jgi:hypothetical protein
VTPPTRPGDPPGNAPATPARRRCPGPPGKTVKCIAWLKAGQAFCRSHDPALADERRANGAKRRQPGDLDGPLGSLDKIAREVARIHTELRAGVAVEVVLEEGELGALVKELLEGEQGTKRHMRIARQLAATAPLDPARANSMLAALRFLAQLVQLRTGAKKGKGSGGDAGGGWGAGGLEGALG